VNPERVPAMTLNTYASFYWVIRDPLPPLIVPPKLFTGGEESLGFSPRSRR